MLIITSEIKVKDIVSISYTASIFTLELPKSDNNNNNIPGDSNTTHIYIYIYIYIWYSIIKDILHTYIYI